MLRAIDENLWCVDSSVRVAPGVRFPARMTVVRHAEGVLLLSPLPIDDALAAELDALGEVTELFAPNLFHHFWLGDASERYPSATVHAPPGLSAKQPGVRIDEALSPARCGAEGAPWLGVFDLHHLDGASDLDEYMLFHRPTQTLIATDLLFNMREVEGALTGLVLRMAGAWKRPAQSRLIRSMTNDREAARASVEALLDLDMQRVIVAHGELLEGAPGEVRETLRGALSWMLAA